MVPSKFEVAEDDQLIGKAFRFENSVENCRERVLVMQYKDKGSFWQMKLFFVNALGSHLKLDLGYSNGPTVKSISSTPAIPNNNSTCKPHHGPLTLAKMLI